MVTFEWDEDKRRANLRKHGVELVIVYTCRDERIRLISARKATRRERKQYEG